MQQKIIPQVEEIQNIDQWNDFIIKNDNPTIVIFQADWCGPCKKAIKALEQQLEMLQKKQDIDEQDKTIKISIAKVNTDTFPTKDLMKEYAKEGIPSIVLFKKGLYNKKIVGYNPKNIEDLFIEALA